MFHLGARIVKSRVLYMGGIYLETHPDNYISFELFTA